MPTENEVKYVLRRDMDVIKTLTHACDDVWHITQTYIHNKTSWNARVRHIIADDDEWFEFTYKNKKFGRTIEIETKIDSRDYYDLIKKPKVILTKTRLIFNTEDHKWEVDLFFDDTDSIYFILAEVEMEEGMTKPLSIPDIISQFIIADVGYNKQYSSSKLANKLYAETMYQNIVDETEESEYVQTKT